MRRNRDPKGSPLERHLDALIDALRDYTSGILSDDEDEVDEAGGAVRAAAKEFVTEAHDKHGGWPNIFAELFGDEPWFDDPNAPQEKDRHEILAVRARYDVVVSDSNALLARGRELADGSPVDRTADALYELLHASPTPFSGLDGVPGLKVIAGAYSFSTVPDPLTFVRMEGQPVQALISMEEGAEVLRGAIDLPQFPSRDAAEETARRAVRKHNLEG